MSILQFQMKTHSRYYITDNYPNLPECAIHNKKPYVLKIVSGRRKETFYCVNCPDDCSCNKISSESPQFAIDAWIKYNTK